ncbi:MAG: hypothetical protein HRT45_15160, partial [Bdellovibrionales bacterium]|nr:hypothetical protein [Bdellovibrionales bacterium]
MKAQKLSSQITQFISATAVLAAGIFSSSALSENYVWRGQERCEMTSSGLQNCQVVDAEVAAAEAIERFSGDRLRPHNQHDGEDCDENPNQGILDRYLHEVDIVGPEDRRPKDRSERPYVASLGFQNSDAEVMTSNGFMAADDVFVLNAHALIRDDGRWNATFSTDRPSDEEFGIYLVNVAGCEGAQAIPVQALCRIGSESPRAEPGLDYAVFRLDRSSCLAENQLPQLRSL